MDTQMVSIIDLLNTYDEMNRERLHFKGAIYLNNQVIHNWKQPIAIRPNSYIKLGKDETILITEEILSRAANRE